MRKPLAFDRVFFWKFHVKFQIRYSRDFLKILNRNSLDSCIYVK